VRFYGCAGGFDGGLGGQVYVEVFHCWGS
jgi:hypothetical protein